MDHIYAVGITIIEDFQYRLYVLDKYFEFVNNISNPHHMLEIVFPIISIIDSVFASQLVLCMAFGGWINAMAKWWLLEDRPYWWIEDTDYYGDEDPPSIRQTAQTCETGPGSPSGHSETISMFALLTIFWMAHVLNDRQWHWKWWKYAWYPLCGASIGSVMLARVYVAAHFPHQVVLGALLGAFLSPFLCIYVIDPFVWQYGMHQTGPVSRAVLWHIAAAFGIIGISFLTYFSIIICGYNPFWTVKLAFRYCENPENIHVSTTPMYSIVHSTAYVFGWAISVTPAVAKYRHNTKDRSLLIAAFGTACAVFLTNTLKHNIKRDNAYFFYACSFLVCVLKVPLLLRGVPYLAMYSYMGKSKID